MQYILVAVLSSVVTLASAFGILNAPLSLFSDVDNFGAISLTEISGTDNLTDFPTTYNANLTAINSGKMDTSTTSVDSITNLDFLTDAGALTTIGTIGTGVWQATDVGVAYGGTGLSNPTQYLVMLGNGSDAMAVASTTGTSGQFLTSNGAGTYPTWQDSSLNQTLDYNFTGSNFLIKNLNASSTSANPLILNGVSYDLPSIDGASSTVLSTDGSGGLTWSNTQATSTVFTSTGTWIRPAGVDKVKVTLVGGGGGAGAVGASANGASKSGGGGSGAYCEAWVSVTGDVTVTIGALGAGASGAGDTGATGGNTTFAGTATITASGGVGGTGTDVAGENQNGGAGGTCTNADFSLAGEVGGNASDLNGSGEGGSNPLGYGARGVISASNGLSASGYGGGGSGAWSTNNDGGSGTAGVAIIEWLE